MIIGTLGYFILPIDLLPDAIVGAGYSDDVVSLTATVTALASCITDDIQNEAKEQLRKIFGEFDEKALDSVTKIIQGANIYINNRNTMTYKFSSSEPHCWRMDMRRIF